MSTDVLLPLALFFALGVPILVILWRVLVVGGQLRRRTQHGRAAIELARRVGVSLDELGLSVDELRRRRAAPESIDTALQACDEAMPRYCLEADSIDRRFAHAEGAGLRDEIERARRAVELIGYGRQLMLDSRGGRFPEAETAVKRGYVNLLHARDAIQARAEAIAAAAATRRR